MTEWEWDYKNETVPVDCFKSDTKDVVSVLDSVEPPPPGAVGDTPPDELLATPIPLLAATPLLLLLLATPTPLLLATPPLLLRDELGELDGSNWSILEATEGALLWRKPWRPGETLFVPTAEKDWRESLRYNGFPEEMTVEVGEE